jgi:NAD(P)-dependent dehydrogenase (short-subunit alcohol dehydrogenase family)
MKIENKTVLITGANRGIGHALVNEALRRGVKRVYAGTRGGLQNADPRVAPLTLDVTCASDIRRAAEKIAALSDRGVIEQHLAVNLFGTFNVTRAFLPLLKRSKGAVVNNLSLAALASLPMIPAYSISKAAALNMTQSLRALLAGEGVTLHAVILGPVDTDMNRGLDIPKASPASTAEGIFDGLQRREEEIFPDPASRSVADLWRTGATKALERQFAAFVPESVAELQ